MARSSFEWVEAGGPPKIFIWGPSGCGKTYTMLSLLEVFAEGKDVAVIDTEGGKSRKYAHRWPLRQVRPKDHSPDTYIALMDEVEKDDSINALGIDSFSHAWIGKNGIVDIHDRHAAMNNKNNFSAWAIATPEQRRLVDRILEFNKPLVCTARAHDAWGVDEGGRPRDMGERPMQGKGIWYEFDVWGYMDHTHTLRIDKSDCSSLDGVEIRYPGKAFAMEILNWTKTGVGLSEADVLRRRIREAARRSNNGDWHSMVDMVGDDVEALTAVLETLEGE